MNTIRFFSSIAAAFALALCAGHARADEPEAPPADDQEPAAAAPEIAGPQPLGTRQRFWRIGTAVRIGYVDDPSLDPFASNDVIPQWTFDVSRTLFARGRVSVSAGVAWDVGGRGDSSARGLNTSLLTQRMTVPIEGRFHLSSSLYAFGRVAPGAAWISVRANDASATSALTDSGWAFASDFSAGASYLLLNRDEPERHVGRVWITPEIGYAWTTEVPLQLTPSDPPPNATTSGSTDLGQLALRGVFFRIGGAITF